MTALVQTRTHELSMPEVLIPAGLCSHEGHVRHKRHGRRAAGVGQKEGDVMTQRRKLGLSYLKLGFKQAQKLPAMNWIVSVEMCRR